MLKIGKNYKKVEEAFLRALEVAKKIIECEKEYDGLFKGFDAGFVEPGASGAITRGKIEVLPTGRNFYAVDPTILPTRAAWKVGVETAKKLLRYYFEKHGKYPESVGHVVWSIDAYKADGEQLAQILYLIGVKPVWGQDGSVKGIEIIPLEELGRPRIDCVLNMSGIVRDTLPNYIYLIDDAITKVGVLDEPVEMNYIRKHYLEHISKLMELGIDQKEAEELAMSKIFCSPPGSYGVGVNFAVEASAWKNDEDLAKTWIHWTGYSYSRRSFGKKAIEALILNLSKVEIVSRNHVSDEHDIFGCCCYYSYHGGFYNAVKSFTEKDIEIVTVDTRDISRTQVRELKEEIERVVRAKLLNPLWIEEMKKHGYRGANEFSKKILHLYGWSATTKLVEDWIFEEIAEKYVLNEEMRKFFEENNIYALEEIVRRLIEAKERGIWNANDELLKKLREIYGEIEGILEEKIVGDVQGGAVEFLSPEDVENWRKNISDVIEAWGVMK